MPEHAPTGVCAEWRIPNAPLLHYLLINFETADISSSASGPWMCATDISESNPCAVALARHASSVGKELDDFLDMASGSSGVCRHIQRLLPSFMKIQSAHLSTGNTLSPDRRY